MSAPQHSPWPLPFDTDPDGFLLYRARPYSIDTTARPGAGHTVWCHGMCPEVAGRARSWADAVRVIREHGERRERAARFNRAHSRAYHLQARLRATAPGSRLDGEQRARALSFLADHARRCPTCADWERGAGRAPVPAEPPAARLAAL